MFKSFPFNSRISLKENAENATASASKLVSPKPKPLEVKQVIVQHRTIYSKGIRNKLAISLPPTG